MDSSPPSLRIKTDNIDQVYSRLLNRCGRIKKKTECYGIQQSKKIQHSCDLVVTIIFGSITHIIYNIDFQSSSDEVLCLKS